MRRVNFVADRVGDPSLPGVADIVHRVAALNGNAMQPAEVLDACLDMVGPIDVSAETYAQLLGQVEGDGPASWATDSEFAASAQRVVQLLAPDRRHERVPVRLEARQNTARQGGGRMKTTVAAGRVWHYSHALGRNSNEDNGATGGYVFPVSVAVAPDGLLYVLSRGSGYQIHRDGSGRPDISRRIGRTTIDERHMGDFARAEFVWPAGIAVAAEATSTPPTRRPT